jgi:hypothetical protein
MPRSSKQKREVIITEDAVDDGHTSVRAVTKYPDCEELQRAWWAWSLEHGEGLFDALASVMGELEALSSAAERVLAQTTPVWGPELGEAIRSARALMRAHEGAESGD